MSKAFKCDLCGKYVEKGHNTIRVYDRKYSKSSFYGKGYELCDKCIDEVLGLLTMAHKKETK